MGRLFNFHGKYPKAFGSSVDPYKLSLTIKGVIKNVAAVALVLAPFLNVSVDDAKNLFDSIDAFVAGLDTLVVAGLSVWGLGETVWGAFRKIAVAAGWIKVS